MKKRMRQYLSHSCLSAFALLVGCAGGDVGLGVEALAFNDSFDAQTLLLGDVSPLATIEAQRWEEAFAGCEGLLDTTAEYGVAEGQPELIVALDVNSNVVCVDSYANVENELGMRSSDDVDALWLGYIATLQTLEADHSVDGTSEESSDADGGNMAEDCVEDTVVTPIIDLGIVSGDPDPQPNDPVVIDAIQAIEFHEAPSE